MSSLTHPNALKQELDKVVQEAHVSLDAVVTKVEAYVKALEVASTPEVTPVTEPVALPAKRSHKKKVTPEVSTEPVPEVAPAEPTTDEVANA